MPGVEHGRNAGGAQRRIPARILGRYERQRARIAGVAQERVHRIRRFKLALGRLDLRHSGEVRAIGVGELRRKIVSADPGECGGETIDGIVLHRTRTMSPRVRHFEAVVLRKFFARLDVEGYAAPLGIEFSGRSLVERKCRIDEFAAILREPFGSIERARRFSPHVSATFSVRFGL